MCDKLRWIVEVNCRVKQTESRPVGIALHPHLSITEKKFNLAGKLMRMLLEVRLQNWQLIRLCTFPDERIKKNSLQNYFSPHYVVWLRSIVFGWGPSPCPYLHRQQRAINWATFFLWTRFLLSLENAHLFRIIGEIMQFCGARIYLLINSSVEFSFWTNLFIKNYKGIKIKFHWMVNLVTEWWSAVTFCACLATRMVHRLTSPSTWPW